MKIVGGLSLKNLKPRVWDESSSFFVNGLSAIMVSYGEFAQLPFARRAAMQKGLRDYLGAPDDVEVYLDNGAFCFARLGGEPTARDYWEFIRKAEPDWRPIRFDAIPSPGMAWQRQFACYEKTMKMNRNYQHDGYVPVVHVGRYLGRYLDDIENSAKLSAKDCLALGGLVPNLLRTPKAAQYSSILDDLISVRERFPEKRIHVFGIGGTATIHLAALLGFDSVDSSGWRNRAARGIIQLPGSGDRMVAELGNWRGRRLSDKDIEKLAKCKCPACKKEGLAGLKANKVDGFSNRATHNLWVLLEEAQWVSERIANGNYAQYYRRRLDNTVYLPLIEKVLERKST